MPARRNARTTGYCRVPRVMRSPSAPTNSGAADGQAANLPPGEERRLTVAGKPVDSRYGLKGNLHVPSFCARRTRTCPGVHHMNLLTPPDLHAPLDAVEQADPIVRGPEKPVEAQDDSVQLAPAPGGAGGDSLEVHGLGLTLADGRRL